MIDVRLADRYRLESEVESGGLTTIWLALDEVLERQVAVKILHRHLLSNEVLCSQFRQEARSAGALTHPHIVAVYDTGSHDEAPYVVMEYLSGGSLAQLLEREGPLAPLRVAALGASVCDALAYAHRAGVFHRDLKPANILLTETGQVKVTDFAIAAAVLAGDITAAGALLGTLSFLAPEVLNGEETGSARADLYALGAVLFQALTGRSPRLASNDPTAGGAKGRLQPARPRDVRPDVPRELDAIVARALSEKPEERFSDAAEMGLALTLAAQARVPRGPRVVRDDSATLVSGVLAPVPAGPPTPVPETRSFVRSEGRWLVPVLLLVATAVAIVIGVLQLSGKLPAMVGGGHPATPPAAAAKPAAQQIPLTPGGFLKPNAPPAEVPEHPELLAHAFSGTPPPWETHDYYGADFGGLWPGIGIWGSLPNPTTLKRIEVDTPDPGWQASIRWSDNGTTWSTPGPGVTVSGTQVFDVSADGSHPDWMVWITRLVPGGGGYQAQISQIKAFS